MLLKFPRPPHLKPTATLAIDKPHGTRVKYMGGCKCVDCRAANTKYELRRAVHRATGRGNGLVPADAAREHLLMLSREGVGRRTVAALTKVAITTLQLIKAGQRKNLRAMSEKKILAVTPDNIRGRALVRAAPTWAIIRYLVDEGYTQTEIATRLGMGRTLQFRGKWIAETTANKVKALFDELELGAEIEPPKPRGKNTATPDDRIHPQTGKAFNHIRAVKKGLRRAATARTVNNRRNGDSQRATA